MNINCLKCLWHVYETVFAFYQIRDSHQLNQFERKGDFRSKYTRKLTKSEAKRKRVFF